MHNSGVFLQQWTSKAAQYEWREKKIATLLRCMPDFPYGQASFPRATLLFTAALLSIINFPLTAARGTVPHAKGTIVSKASN